MKGIMIQKGEVRITSFLVSRSPGSAAVGFDYRGSLASSRSEQGYRRGIEELLGEDIGEKEDTLVAEVLKRGSLALKKRSRVRAMVQTLGRAEERELAMREKSLLLDN